jgi:hypothetical protein
MLIAVVQERAKEKLVNTDVRWISELLYIICSLV